MSRELRFRVWADGAFYYADDILSGAVGFHSADRKTILMVRQDINSTPHTERLVMHSRKGLALEQWTGLQDLHGHPIFEGDILSWEPDETQRRAWWAEGDGRGDLAIVEWLVQPPICGWVGAIQSRHGGEGFEPLLAQGYHDRWIVLGNVHQNPELLGQPPVSP